MVDPHFGLVRISATKYAKLPASITAAPATRRKARAGRSWKETIPFMKHVKCLVDAGYSVLTYDTRNHGESDTGTCEWVTCRDNERTGMDLAAVTFMDHVHALAA